MGAGYGVPYRGQPRATAHGWAWSMGKSRACLPMPRFTWIDGHRVERYDEQRGIAIGKKVMARRNRTMGTAEERAFLSAVRQALAIERQPLDSELLA